MKLARMVACGALAAGLLIVEPGVSGAQQAPAPADSNMIFDVRNGDQTGKLMLREADVSFESLTDARHSRTWKYVDLREVSKKGKNLRLKPFKGSTYDFQFKDKGMRDRLYDLISQRVVTARANRK